MKYSVEVFEQHKYIIDDVKDEKEAEQKILNTPDAHLDKQMMQLTFGKITEIKE